MHSATSVWMYGSTIRPPLQGSQLVRSQWIGTNEFVWRLAIADLFISMFSTYPFILDKNASNSRTLKTQQPTGHSSQDTWLSHLRMSLQYAAWMAKGKLPTPTHSHRMRNSQTTNLFSWKLLWRGHTNCNKGELSSQVSYQRNIADARELSYPDLHSR